MKKANYDMLDPFDAILLDAIKNPMKRYHFYKSFLDLELVALGSVSSESNQDTPTLHLTYIEMENEVVLPVYSSLEKFRSIYQSNYTYVKIKASQLLQLIELDSPWVLNAGFDCSKKIIREELETLRDRKILHYFFEELDLEEKRRFLTDQIVEMPTSTLDAISNSFRSFPSIKKAFVTNIFNPADGGEATPLIGIELDDTLDIEFPNEFLSDVYNAVNQPTHIQVEIVVLTEELPLTHSILEHIKPFYERTTTDNLHSLFR